MTFLKRLLTLSLFTLLAGLVGIGVGILVAPAKGSETRAVLHSLIDQHGPTVKQNMQEASNSMDSAIDYVVSHVDDATEKN